MFKSSKIYRLAGFLSSIVFSAAVIFACSFGIVGVFKALSTYNLDDMSSMANQDADTIVATITGTAADKDSFQGQLMSQMSNIIYGFEDKESYTFQEATNDAKSVLEKFFSGFGLDNINDSCKDVVSSITDMVGGEEAVNDYVDKYDSSTK